MLNAQEKCNVVEMFPQEKRDFSAMIPQSILPDTEKELNEVIDIEDNMADSEGMDAMPIDATTGKRKSSKTGRVVGRPCIDYPNGWEQVYKRWKAKEIKAVEAMKILNLKKNSFYTLVKRYEN
jgi:hypothetical protein